MLIENLVVQKIADFRGETQFGAFTLFVVLLYGLEIGVEVVEVVEDIFIYHLL